MDTRLSVYNLLVHYGPKGENNFIDLIEDNIIEVLIESPEIQIRKKEYFAEELELIKGKGTYYLKGRFSKQFDFLSDRQMEEQKKVNKDILIQSLPHAYFLLDLVNHRLIWGRPKGITAPPSASNFCTFLKRKINQYLEAEERSNAESYWQSLGKGKEPVNKFQFVNDYLKNMGVRLSDIEVEALPLINKDEIRNLIMNEDAVVKLLKMKMYRPNASDREIKEAKGSFDDVARFFNETLNTNPELTVKPAQEAGTKKKEEVVKIVETMSDLENIKLDIHIQSRSTKKTTVITTSPEGDGENDVKFKKDLPKSPEFLDAEDVEAVKKEMPEFEINEEEKESNKKIVMEWISRVRKVFPKFPVRG